MAAKINNGPVTTCFPSTWSSDSADCLRTWLIQQLKSAVNSSGYLSHNGPPDEYVSSPKKRETLFNDWSIYLLASAFFFFFNDGRQRTTTPFVISFQKKRNDLFEAQSALSFGWRSSIFSDRRKTLKRRLNIALCLSSFWLRSFADNCRD